ncbi:MAG: metal-dependent hydrolase [Chitinophagales bacterium]
MDSLSQIALGAAMGELATGRKAGNKAMFWGAVGGTIPDLDVLGAPFLDPISNLLFHRGFTHSFWFAFVMAPVLGYLLYYYYRNKAPNVSLIDWIWLFFLALFTHPILDCFTTWGTQYFTPFSDYRVAFNTVFVVDPSYTVPFIICLGLAATLHRNRPLRKHLNYLGIGLSCGYILFTVVNKHFVDRKFYAAMERRNIAQYEFMSAPTPLNNILWHATVCGKDSIWIGYYSLFDRDDQIDFESIPRNLEWAKPYENIRAYKVLKYVSKDFFAIDKSDSSLVFYDLRFGLIDGWNRESDEIKLPFHWEILLEKDEEGEHIVIQKRPDFKITGKMWRDFYRRVKGV